MAKNKYTVSTTVDIVGMLDYDESDRLVVLVETGKGDNTIIQAVDLLTVLEECVGREIILKLNDEESRI